MTSPSDAAREYASTHIERFTQELKEMLRFPSLSGDPAHAGDIRAMAEWLAAHLDEIGCANVAVMPTAGHPVVYGEWMGAGPDAPTVLVYGHYDVVPASLEDGWSTPPFEPVIKDGAIYARGATDNKGQLFTHVKALESWLKTAGAAPANVKFFLEGEEEVASPNLLPFLKEHLELLRADVCAISDSSMRTIDEPVILYSLRGMTYIEIHVSGPRDDLHSGFWGGAVHNPAIALSQIVASFFNADGTIAVAGFYDDVVPLGDEEREMLNRHPGSDEQSMEATGVPAMWGDPRYTILERTSARPTLDVNGLWSGWSGPGPKTIIPASAGAKVSCRLVGNQDPQRIYELLKAHVESVTPPTVRVEVRLLTTGMPALIPFEDAKMQAAVRAYERAWGASPFFTRGGGSIPVVADIASLMKIPVVMMGFGLDSDGLHAADEHYRIDMFEKGIATSIVFLEEVANLPRSNG